MRVGMNGRVTIPKDIRRILDIDKGDEIVFHLDRENDRIIAWKDEDEEASNEMEAV